MCNPEREMPGKSISCGDPGMRRVCWCWGWIPADHRGRWRWRGLRGRTARILGQTELAGRSYSATLVAAVEENCL